MPKYSPTFLEDKRLLPPQTIQEGDIQLIGSLFNSIKNIEEKYSFIKRSLTIFNSLRNTPIREDLSILGLFIVIESLITHRPGDKETYDSLTHQVSSKVPLISRRFDRQIDCTKFFDSDNESTIWKRLYEYRSKIAHGRGAEVDGRLKILKDRRNIYDFLHIITKHLLVQSLKEPQLIDDLKGC